MTDKSPNIDVSEEIIGEACAWIAQIETGNLSGEDLAALREWMGRSPAHLREIRDTAHLSGQLNVLAQLAGSLDQVTAVHSPLRRQKWGWIAAKPTLSGAVGLCLVAVIMFTYFFSLPTINSTDIYQTSVGEYQTIDLSDGSIVKLNTDSQIEVSFSSDVRRVRVINGEAFFDVAKDVDRPFVVFSGKAVAQAIGTAFVVRLRDAVTEISVIEGTVAFAKVEEVATDFTIKAPSGLENASHEASQNTPDVLLRAGQSYTSLDLSDDQLPSNPLDIPTLSDRDIQRKISWTEGLFDFSNTRLEEVVEEISRHNELTIEIADASLKDVEFGGIFRTGDVESLMEALQVLGVEVVRINSGHVQLRKKADS